MNPKYLRIPAAVAALLLVVSGLRAEEAAPGPIAAKLQPFVDSQTLAGAVVLVANKEKILDIEAVGFEDVAAKKAMRTNDLFWIASQSKPITAAALMILVDEGKVNVDDPVEKYLPEFKDQMLEVKKDNEKVLQKPKHPITVKNILSHTSGLPFASPIEKPTLDQRPLSERVISYAKNPLVFEPDTKYQYSNAGINTAGRIIEVVSGMSYEEFLDKRFFEPLGMKDTTFWPNEEQLTRLAKSYKPRKEKNEPGKPPVPAGLDEITVGQLKYPLNDRANRWPMPAGGLFSTATDMALFSQMILNNGEFKGKRYISEASIKQMTSKQTGELKDGYGFGWSTGGKPGDSFGHGGAFATNFSIDPQKGLIYIYMVQHAGFANDGGKIWPTFQKAANEAFGAK